MTVNAPIVTRLKRWGRSSIQRVRVSPPALPPALPASGGFPHLSCNVCPRTGKEHMRKPYNEAGIEKKTLPCHKRDGPTVLQRRGKSNKRRYAKPSGDFY